MKIIKHLILLLILIVTNLIYNTYADSTYHNFSYITGNAYLNFNGQIDGVNYSVNLETGKFDYLTGSDGKIYHCFNIYGTGYTDTIGEVYFGYGNYKAYSCADGVLRGYAKLSSGGRILLDDKNIGDGLDWMIKINYNSDNIDQDVNGKHYHYHSKDSFGGGNGLAFTNGLGFWNWNLSKINLSTSSYILAFVDKSKSIISLSSGKFADGVDVSSFALALKDSNGLPFNGLFLDRIGFDPGLNSFFRWKNPAIGVYQSTLFFQNGENFHKNLLLSNSNFNSNVVSLTPGNGNYTFQISGASGTDMKLFLTGNVDFLPKFTNSFNILDGNGDGKVLIGDGELGQIKVNPFDGASNILYSGNLIIDSTYPYTVNNGQDFIGSNAFALKLSPASESVDTKVNLKYGVVGTFDFTFPTTLKTYTGLPFQIITQSKYIYADKKIASIKYSYEDCSNKFGNGIDACKIKISLKNKINLPIPYIKFDLFVNDLNQLLPDKYTSFDLDEYTPTYENGLHYNSVNNYTDSRGNFDLYVRSYKPVYGGKLRIVMNNLQNYYTEAYNWIGENTINSIDTDADIYFNKIVDILFTGLGFENGVALNENNEITLVYNKLITTTNITNPGYKLVGSIIGCSDCSFVQGSEFIGSSFASTPKTIVITGSVQPDIIQYYTDYYNYSVEGVNGYKNVKLVPNIKVNGKKLNIIGQFFGLKLFGLANRSFNYAAITDVAVIGSNVPFSNYISDIEKQIFNSTRGKKINKVIGELKLDNLDNLGSTLYECDNGAYVSLQSIGDIIIKGKNDLVFKNCPVHIKSNILRQNPQDRLTITSIGDSKFDTKKADGWRGLSTIYIYPIVDTLMLNIVSNGTILLPADNSTNQDKIFVSKRWDNTNLKRQLYIKGKIMARNTLGGGFVSEDYYVLPGGRKVKTSDFLFEQNTIPAESFAQAFDMQFWRASYVKNSTYDINILSPIIKSKYSCTGFATDDKICMKPIVLENDL